MLDVGSEARVMVSEDTQSPRRRCTRALGLRGVAGGCLGSDEQCCVSHTGPGGCKLWVSGGSA